MSLKTAFGKFIAVLLTNWVTTLGASITTVTAIAIVVLSFLSLAGTIVSQYASIFTFVVLPAVFVLGLILIPVGVLWQRRRDRTLGKAPGEIIEFRGADARRAVGIFGFLTLVNVFIISSVSYQAIAYSRSDEFCGMACHTVMEPQYTRYLEYTHGNASCGSCHFGEGVAGFVREKVAGVRQLYAVAAESYEKPIPVPLEHRVPPQVTCRRCHKFQHQHGDQLIVNVKYSEDEANTPLYTVLSMHVGGGPGEEDTIHGWHINPDREMLYYASDEDHQQIDLVRVVEPDGSVLDYLVEGSEVDPNQITNEELHAMDCYICHNRTGHPFFGPNEALDIAMAEERITPSLPWIKRAGLNALESVGIESRDDANSKIESVVRSFYEEEQPEVLETHDDEIDDAINELKTIYANNVFPEMGIDWNHYIDNRGHTENLGCFRCHDDQHTTMDGSRTISQDCTSCHQVLAWDEESPDILPMIQGQ